MGLSKDGERVPTGARRQCGILTCPDHSPTGSVRGLHRNPTRNSFYNRLYWRTGLAGDDSLSGNLNAMTPMTTGPGSGGALEWTGERYVPRDLRQHSAGARPSLPVGARTVQRPARPRYSVWRRVRFRIFSRARPRGSRAWTSLLRLSGTPAADTDEKTWRSSWAAARQSPWGISPWTS